MMLLFHMQFGRIAFERDDRTHPPDEIDRPIRTAHDHHEIPHLEAAHSAPAAHRSALAIRLTTCGMGATFKRS